MKKVFVFGEGFNINSEVLEEKQCGLKRKLVMGPAVLKLQLSQYKNNYVLRAIFINLQSCCTENWTNHCFMSDVN